MIALSAAAVLSYPRIQEMMLAPPDFKDNLILIPGFPGRFNYFVPHTSTKHLLKILCNIPLESIVVRLYEPVYCVWYEDSLVLRPSI